MSDFPVEFDELYFVAAYLYASTSIKHGPVALVEAYVLMFSASLCSSHSKLGLQSAFENFIISNLLFLQESFVEVCEIMLTNNYGISIRHTAAISRSASGDVVKGQQLRVFDSSFSWRDIC